MLEKTLKHPLNCAAILLCFFIANTLYAAPSGLFQVEKPAACQDPGTEEPPTVMIDTSTGIEYEFTSDITESSNISIVFVLDTSTSMNKHMPGGSRFNVAKRAINMLLDDIPDSVNVGFSTLASYCQSHRPRGYRSPNFYPPRPLSTQVGSRTWRDHLKISVNAARGTCYTPVASTYFELFRWHLGQSHHPAPTHTGDTLFVLMSDGDASMSPQHHRDWLSAHYRGARCPGRKQEHGCLIHSARHFYHNDANPNVEGIQRIRHFTVGVAYNSHRAGYWLQHVAGGSNGYFQYVHSSTAYRNALQRILGTISTEYPGSITATTVTGEQVTITDAFIEVPNSTSYTLKDPTTLSQPILSINPNNRYTHGHEIYYSLFKYHEFLPRWPGNIKQYKMSNDGVLISARQENGSPVPVLDDNNKISANAQDFWSNSGVDGNILMAGGIRDHIASAGSRKIYTNLSNSGTNTTLNDFNGTNIDLINLIKSERSLSTAEAQSLIGWARGIDVPGTPRKLGLKLADALNSSPVVVWYGGTDATPDKTIFFSDNAGFIRAVKADSGKEIFSFFAKEQLETLHTLYKNEVGAPHPFGFDGPLTVWRHDHNGDGKITHNDNSGDRVILYATQRRGGDAIFALDVTDRNTPKLQWQLSSSDTGFEQLGQTWSKVVKSRIMHLGAERHVILFSGGYDPINDDLEADRAGQTGNAVYMVDALTKEILWSSSASGSSLNLSEMVYAMPGDIKLLDLNRDGLLDQFYVADTGGQLFRFDVQQGYTVGGAATSPMTVTGSRVASLSDNNRLTHKRRFFTSPDISLVHRNGKHRLTVAFGSGSRATPNSKAIQDRFYVIFYDDVHKMPSPYKVVTEAHLYDATDDLITHGDAAQKAQARADLEAKMGWYIDLEKDLGEKILSNSMTFGGVVYFSSFVPINFGEGSTLNCDATPSARLYTLDILTAARAEVWREAQTGSTSTENTSTTQKRWIELNHHAIAPQPTRIKVPGDNNTSPSDIICIGLECNEVPKLPMRPTFWTIE